MPCAPVPSNEAERLAALRSYRILNAEHDESLDAVCRIVCAVFDSPIALVSLSDANRQVFRGRVGLDADELARGLAPCAYAILGDTPLVIPDASQDARFVDNPLVLNPPNVRFYVGVPLLTPDRFALGTLCAIDSRAKTPSPSELKILADLGQTVMTIFNMRKAMSRAREFALTDTLTGLANRAGIMLELESYIEECAIKKTPFAILYIDVDDFKNINDTHGHAAGDDVLQLIGETMSRSVRKSDTAGRHGGDEFCILMSHCDRAEASRFAQRILDSLTSAVAARDYVVGFSIGLACFTRPPASVAEALLTADRLMYAAKHSGKNRIVSALPAGVGVAV